jgi:hypothetical protein
VPEKVLEMRRVRKIQKAAAMGGKKSLHWRPPTQNKATNAEP